MSPLLLALALASCARNLPVGAVRFANQPVVWRVNDTLPVRVRPKAPGFAFLLYHFDGLVARNLDRRLALTSPHRAANTNALDEVPNSTWFTNRIGLRTMSAQEVGAGPNDVEGPEQHKPWTIVGTKVGGLSVGFIMKDSRGTRYLLKFDQKGFPELETAADIIAQRLLWAFGYNVPEDRIVHFARSDLRLSEDAAVKDTFGNERAMTEADLDEGLAKVNVTPGEPIRGMVSKYVSGTPLGGYTREGTRDDDINDVIAHQDRRDVRGLMAMAAWLGHTDIKDGNTLDVWQVDPLDPSRHYVLHYLVDFGKALGTLGRMESRVNSTYTYVTDFRVMFESIFTLGLWRRPWEGASDPGLRGVGLYDVEHYAPGEYKPNAPYFPFDDADRFDGFWGAKILMRFTPEQIAAVVGEAQFSDPKASAYLIRTLVARQRATARYWFARVTPIDNFFVDSSRSGFRLCFDDLMRVYNLDHDHVRYVGHSFDRAGRRTGWQATERADRAGRICLNNIRPGDLHRNYTIVRIAPRRSKLMGSRRLPAVLVHIANTPGGSVPRVIGLQRL